MKQKIMLSPRKIEMQIEQAFAVANRGLHRNMVEQITNDKWQWRDGGTRDIVDTSLLRSSQQPPNFVTPLKAFHVNTVAYALPVHEGATLKNGTELPARPWMTQALKEFNFLSAMKKAYKGDNFTISG